MEGETTPRRPSGRRRRAIVAVAGVGLALSAGVAYGATHGSSSPGAAVLDDAAKRLGVSSATLRSALQQATIDQINKQVAAGHLTRSQADAIIAHLKQGDGLGFGFGGPPGGFGQHGFGHFDGHGPGPGGPFGFMDTVASYLGLTDAQLRTQLMSGKSLADIAKAQGKSVSGLESAIVSAATTRLDQAVKDGHLTADQEKHILSEIKEHVDDLVTHGFGEHRPMMGGGTSPDTGAGSPPPGGPWT